MAQEEEREKNRTDTDDAENASRDPSGFYAILGVSRTADAAEIRRSYLHHSTTYHTDKHATKSAEIQHIMNARFQQLSEAYQVLGDPTRRLAYDHSGKAGVERLALIPKTLTQHEDISRTLDVLKFEADARRTARALSARSDIEVLFNAVPLFQKAAAKPARDMPPAPKPARDMPPAPKPARDMPPAPKQTSEVGQQSTVDNKPLGDDPQATKGQPPLPDSIPENVTAQVEVREVILDGVHQVVFVPPPQVQKNFLARTQKRQSAAPSIFRCLIPVSLTFSSSFEQQVNDYNVTIATAARKGKSEISLTADIQRSPAVMHSYILHFSSRGAKVVCVFKRALSAVWRMTTRLVLFDGTQLLPTLTSSLSRKLSATAEIAWNWRMTFSGKPYFSWAISDSDAKGQHVRKLEVSVSRGSFNISALSREAAVLNRGTTHRAARYDSSAG